MFQFPIYLFTEVIKRSRLATELPFLMPGMNFQSLAALMRPASAVPQVSGSQANRVCLGTGNPARQRLNRLRKKAEYRHSERRFCAKNLS